MGDSNTHNTVEAAGAQGGNFVNSTVNNVVFNIHTPGRNYQKIKVIGRGTFGNAWLVKPKNVAGGEGLEFVMTCRLKFMIVTCIKIQYDTTDRNS